MREVPTVQWDGCYDDSWRDLIVPEAFAHPAKMARGLLSRIFDELFAMGALKVGDLVCDPFAGVGTTGIAAASRGVRFIGVELEGRFHALAKDNFELHRRDWEAMGRPQPVILQGDSRRLRRVLGPVLAECVVSSPPYEGNTKSDYLLSEDGKTRARDERRGFRQGRGCFRGSEAAYGDTDGQLGVMDHSTVDAVLGSPPFSQGYSGGGGINVRGYGPDGKDKVGSRTYQGRDADRIAGNLETMPLGTVAAVVSSPPFLDARSDTTASVKGRTPSSHDPEAMGTAGGNLSRMSAGNVDTIVSSPPKGDYIYGDSADQLGQQQGETFWSAAKLILEECFTILKPGGFAVFVLKDYVRNKKRIPFSADWLKLCEACGFELVKEVRASLVERWDENTLFRGVVAKERKRASFFRRLAEKKGSPRIDHEDVIFLRKPEWALLGKEKTS